MNKQPKKDVIVVFSGRPNSHFFEVGGTAAWVLNPVRARECVYALITRNAHDKRWIPGPEKHLVAVPDRPHQGDHALGLYRRPLSDRIQ